MPLWAVHISDGVLTLPFWAGGFVLAALLLFWGCRKIQDDEIPRIALVTAAFFIASTIHVKAPPTSVHLLLNGLAGALLGRRAVAAIFGGLLLQAILLNHGGFYALGVNTCVMTIPALLAAAAHHGLERLGASDSRPARSILMLLSCVLLALSTIFSIAMVVNLLSTEETWQSHFEAACTTALAPWSLLIVAAVAGIAVAIEHRSKASPVFASGFLLGSLTVLLTSALNCAVLLVGGEEVWPVAPWAMVVLHLPIAVIEGLIVGVTLGFLSRVKPELIGRASAAPAAASAPASTKPVTPVNEEAYDRV